mmetsp:Transcript_77674/g.175631  ORF Transcript_77674/g.175631 Transcript_77674/m.175631 type:complete len:255 (+) Transcript_77674:145-909(+)
MRTWSWSTSSRLSGSTCAPWASCTCGSRAGPCRSTRPWSPSLPTTASCGTETSQGRCPSSTWTSSWTGSSARRPCATSPCRSCPSGRSWSRACSWPRGRASWRMTWPTSRTSRSPRRAMTRRLLIDRRVLRQQSLRRRGQPGRHPGARTARAAHAAPGVHAPGARGHARGARPGGEDVPGLAAAGAVLRVGASTECRTRRRRGRRRPTRSGTRRRRRTRERRRHLTTRRGRPRGKRTRTASQWNSGMRSARSWG